MAFYNRGTAYDRQGEADKALEDYRNAARLRPVFAPAFAALGRLLKDKDPDTAESELSEAIRLDQQSAALRSHAILYLSMGRQMMQQPQKALTDLNAALASAPKNLLALLGR